jgi:hypothetical protein
MGTATEVSQPHDSASASGKASGKTSVKSAEAATGDVEFRGVNLGMIKIHARFLWLTMLASCSLIEYGFDHGMVGSFQAMVGFLKVFGYEDPRMPSGWVSTLPTSVDLCREAAG